MCSHFRENWLHELPDLLPLFSKRELTFIFSRDIQGNNSFPYCRYGYSCKYRYIDCGIPYFKAKRVAQPIQLSLF